MHYEGAMRCDVLCTAHTVNAPDERAQGSVGAPIQWSDCIHVRMCHATHIVGLAIAVISKVRSDRSPMTTPNMFSCASTRLRE
jgi:hypothetical protein